VEVASYRLNYRTFLTRFRSLLTEDCSVAWHRVPLEMMNETKIVAHKGPASLSPGCTRSGSSVAAIPNYQSTSIHSRWPSQLILCPIIHCTVFSPLLISSNSRFVLLFHSSFSYLGPYILILFHPFHRPWRPLGRIEVSASRLGRILPPGKTRYPLYRRISGPQGRTGQVRKISPHTGIQSPERPARSQSLYRLSYRAHVLIIFLSKMNRACSFFVVVHVSPPYASTGLISVLYNRILVALDKSRLLKRLIAAK
jgi:hypothetical protein